MTGRPTKLTPEAEEAICEALRYGASWAQAAAEAGIAERTVINWRQRGEKATTGQFFHFLQRATRARAKGEAQAVRQVFQSFMLPTVETIREELPDGTVKVRTIERPPDAGMALKWLERRCPEDWNPRTVLEHSGHVSGGYADREVVVIENYLQTSHASDEDGEASPSQPA